MTVKDALSVQISVRKRKKAWKHWPKPFLFTKISRDTVSTARALLGQPEPVGYLSSPSSGNSSRKLIGVQRFFKKIN